MSLTSSEGYPDASKGLNSSKVSIYSRTEASNLAVHLDPPMASVIDDNNNDIYNITGNYFYERTVKKIYREDDIYCKDVNLAISDAAKVEGVD